VPTGRTPEMSVDRGTAVGGRRSRGEGNDSRTPGDRSATRSGAVRARRSPLQSPTRRIGEATPGAWQRFHHLGQERVTSHVGSHGTDAPPVSDRPTRGSRRRRSVTGEGPIVHPFPKKGPSGSNSPLWRACGAPGSSNGWRNPKGPRRLRTRGRGCADLLVRKRVGTSIQ
jgi:hypothetical protein